MRFNTDESVSYEPPLCGATMHKTTIKYGALMCIVNGQIRPNEGVWMQEAQRMLRLEADMY